MNLVSSRFRDARAERLRWQRSPRAGGGSDGYGPGSIQELIFGYHCQFRRVGVFMRTAPLIALFVDGLLVGEILSACSPAAMGPGLCRSRKIPVLQLRAARWSADVLDEPRAGIEAADGQGRAGHGRYRRQCHCLPD